MVFNLEIMGKGVVRVSSARGHLNQTAHLSVKNLLRFQAFEQVKCNKPWYNEPNSRSVNSLCPIPSSQPRARRYSYPSSDLFENQRQVGSFLLDYNKCPSQKWNNFSPLNFTLPHLVLTSSRGRPLTLVWAPAGNVKSNLIGCWLESVDCRTACLSLMVLIMSNSAKLQEGYRWLAEHY